MNKPNFLIIGAGKAGTTSLYEYLRQHPQIFMSAIKETNFFAYAQDAKSQDRTESPGGRAFFPVRSFDRYLALFDDARNEIAVGEASPVYLYAPGVPERIRHSLPDAKFIVILRDPVERAWSSYLMYRALDIEQREFEQAIRDEQTGVNHELPSGQWHYLEAGLYYQHLQRYLEIFDRCQFEILLYEDLARDAGSVLRQVFRFLKVDENFSPDTSVKFHPSGVPRNPLVHWLLRKRRFTSAIKNNLPEGLRRYASTGVATAQQRNLYRPPLQDELRNRLVSYFEHDIQCLEQLLERDLVHWLNSGKTGIA